jgi:PhnB protein
MARRSPAQQLDDALQAMLTRDAGPVPPADEEVRPLLDLASELRDVPRPSFKTFLELDLQRRIRMGTAVEPVTTVKQTATARLRIRNAAAAIEFYKRAFGAKELWRFEPGDTIGHAEISIGNSVIMLSDEAPAYGAAGPETLGGSPVTIQLLVDDVDSFVERAVQAGARIVLPVQDQFYGMREGTLADPFGYQWGVRTVKEEMSLEEMHRRFDEMMKPSAEAKASGVSPIPKGYHTVTPYLVAADAPGLIDFVQRAFGGEETFRSTGSAGGVHAEVRVGDSMLMIGGGSPQHSWRGDPIPTSLHIYVKDADATYRRALEAGGTSIEEPVDQPYGDREAGIKDAAGNLWWIATHQQGEYIPKGMHTITPFMHPLRGEPVIAFLKRAFGAEEVDRHASPEGVIHHARIKVGDSMIELGEAHGPYQPMPSMFYLYVPDVDASYQRALRAGGTSISGPADHSYGDRSAGVKDPFGNQWYIATHIKDVSA